MASRRELKKNVNYIAGELFTECLINSMFIPGTDKVKADEFKFFDGEEAFLFYIYDIALDVF